MPNRILRTRALTSRRLGESSPAAEALYYRLMLVADDYGRFHGETPIVQSACYPRGERDITEPLEELGTRGLIHFYTVGEDRYLHFDVWDQATRARDSRFPAPEDATPLHASARKRDAHASHAPTDVGLDVDGDGDVKREPIARARDVLFDTLAEATGRDPRQMTRREARACGTALADIRRATPDLTPAEIQRRVVNYRAHMPHATITPSALANHWSLCDKGPLAVRDPSNDLPTAKEALG